MSDDLYDKKVIELDGSLFEGGGQMVRNGISLSVILGIPVRIFNIRRNRPKPGLMKQHLVSLQLLGEMTSAYIKNGIFGSTDILFSPCKPILPKEYNVDVGTAGSISLILQTILPTLIFDANAQPGTTVIDMRGGTNVKFCPQIESLEMGLFSILNAFTCDNKMDYKIDMKLRGCYPKGGGKIIFKIKHPLSKYPLNPITLTSFGKITSAKIFGWSCGRAPISIAKRAINYIEPEIVAFGCEPKTVVTCEPKSGRANCSGVGVITALYTDTGCALVSDHLFARGEDVDTIGYRTANELLKTDICVDNHTQDQLIIFMALSSGVSLIKCSYPLTNHTLSAIYVIKQFCPKINFEYTINEQNHTCILSCTGIGWTPQMSALQK